MYLDYGAYLEGIPIVLTRNGVQTSFKLNFNLHVQVKKVGILDSYSTIKGCMASAVNNSISVYQNRWGDLNMPPIDINDKSLWAISFAKLNTSLTECFGNYIYGSNEHYQFCGGDFTGSLITFKSSFGGDAKTTRVDYTFPIKCH